MGVGLAAGLGVGPAVGLGLGVGPAAGLAVGRATDDDHVALGDEGGRGDLQALAPPLERQAWSGLGLGLRLGLGLGLGFRFGFGFGFEVGVGFGLPGWAAPRSSEGGRGAAARSSRTW